MGNHCLLVFTGKSSFQGFLSGANWISSIPVGIDHILVPIGFAFDSTGFLGAAVPPGENFTDEEAGWPPQKSKTRLSTSPLVGFDLFWGEGKCQQTVGIKSNRLSICPFKCCLAEGRVGCLGSM